MIASPILLCLWVGEMQPTTTTTLVRALSTHGVAGLIALFSGVCGGHVQDETGEGVSLIHVALGCCTWTPLGIVSHSHNLERTQGIEVYRVRIVHQYLGV